MLAGRRITATIPALNESAPIARVIGSLYAVQTPAGPLLDHIIVVDNHSSDSLVQYEVSLEGGGDSNMK